MDQDEEKVEICRADNITLVIIPYWWDGKRESLIATIRDQRPDLLLSSTTSGAPTVSTIPVHNTNNHTTSKSDLRAHKRGKIFGALIDYLCICTYR